MKPPLAVLVIYRVLAIVFALLGLYYLILSLVQFQRLAPRLPFALLSMTAADFLFAYGFWRLRRWTATLIALAVFGVLLASIFWGELFSALAIILSILFGAVLFAVVYLTRQFLSGEYFSPAPILTFLFLLAIDMATIVS